MNTLGSGAIFEPEDDYTHTDRAAKDRGRHDQKVRGAIRESIGDILSEESIIGRDKDRIIKIPIRGIKEYRFVFGDNGEGVGAGDGDSQPGQVIGQKNGNKGGPASDQEGVDYYEMETTLDDLIQIMFEDFALPDLEDRSTRIILSLKSMKRRGWRHVGPRQHLDRRKTGRQRVRSKVARGVGGFATSLSRDALDLLSPEDQERYFWKEDEQQYVLSVLMRKEDLIFKKLVQEPQEESNAVVVCVMDTSGSMDTMKKYLARVFFFLLHQFIMTKYVSVDLIFVAHHTTAKEVTEDEFFHKGESGGTLISSGYNKAIEIILDRYHPTLWNVYAVHCSDGDNFDSDNAATLKAAKALCELCQLFGYVEIKPLGSHYYESSMLDMFRSLEEPNFTSVLIEGKEDIYGALEAFFGTDEARSAARREAKTKKRTS